MAFTTITEEQQADMGVSGLPDTPALDTADMQQKFDELGNAAVDWLQTHVTEIEAAAAALSIGCTAPTGITVADSKLQSVINEIARIAVDAGNKAHVHANKSTLDAISAEVKAKYDALASILGTVEAYDSETLVSSATAIPSSAAVSAFVTAFDIASKLLAKAYPVGSCYIGPNSPATFLGGTWTEVSDTGISSDYTVWKRTA